MQSKIVEEDIKKKEERLGLEVRSLLVAGTALSVARNRLQVILVNNFLGGCFYSFLFALKVHVIIIMINIIIFSCIY